MAQAILLKRHLRQQPGRLRPVLTGSLHHFGAPQKALQIVRQRRKERDCCDAKQALGTHALCHAGGGISDACDLNGCSTRWVEGLGIQDVNEKATMALGGEASVLAGNQRA